ncbi:MAG: S41 family peptidase [Candidatus Zixiibacteriota bacterium]|nr:MAG: S41 family peptidase [candidate division Zixibacteria bacterium]
MPQFRQLTVLPSGHRRWAGYRTPAMIVLAVILLGLVSVNAQTVVGPREDVPSIDNTTKAAIIDSVSATLNRIYVFPEVAQKMEKHMRKQLKSGAYDDLNNTASFAEKINEELGEISKDGHLWVRYIPSEETERFSPSDTLTDEERLRREQEALRRKEYDNFAFVKAERLSGNVGYLRLDGFMEAKYGGATAIAALNFLAYCDALIIDMRNNGGGEPSMIQLMTSYFFDEPVHLNTFYIRETDSLQQFWTQEQVQGPRMSDVDLYVLTSGYSFSAAEEFTYNLKNLERATIIGETTGGGAHPTDRHVFADLNVAMSCPFGRAINPITGTNWEGTGVEPDIAVPQEQALDVAHLEAMKKLADKATDEEIKQSLLWNIETKETLLNPVTVAPEILQSYVGTYGPRTITFEKGVLLYKRENGPQRQMIPMAEDLFCFEDIDYFRLKVIVDEQGKPVELMGLYAGGHTDVSPRDPDK